jgi:hypothetical protein
MVGGVMEADEYIEVGREGGVIYERRGTNVYRRLRGCERKHYCIASRWERSMAARRIRGEFGAMPYQHQASNDIIAELLATA